VGSLQDGEVVDGAPAPSDQEEGRVIAGAAAPLLFQSVGECAHHRAYSLLGVFDAVDPVDGLLLAELLFACIVFLDQAVGEAQHPVAGASVTSLIRGS
jgi:hypothetical protein